MLQIIECLNGFSIFASEVLKVKQFQDPEQVKSINHGRVQINCCYMYKWIIAVGCCFTHIVFWFEAVDFTSNAAVLFIKVSLKDFLFSKPEKEGCLKSIMRDLLRRYLHFLVFPGEFLKLLFPLIRGLRSGGSLGVAIDHLWSLSSRPLEGTGNLKQRTH